MEAHIDVQPLPYKTRQRTFVLLLLVFAISLPFLYLYATGYRFDLEKPTNLVSTGGIYLAVERTGAEIFIDNELVRETRTFRKAFYAQSLDVGTHRVHVQKDGFHTWVKELPVSKHRVTEAEAFNLPLVPQVRVISPWLTATGTVVVPEEITYASTTNATLASTTISSTTLVVSEEYKSLVRHFASTTEDKSDVKTPSQLRTLLQSKATSTEEGESATSTIVSNGVKLYEAGDDVFATWVGSFEEMPYYYCAPDFVPYSTTTVESERKALSQSSSEVEEEPITTPATSKENGLVIHPVQTIPKDTVCDPTIRIDRMWEKVRDFDFLPGTTDFVIMGLENGVYVVEIDDRAWQNTQPLFRGKNLSFHIENGSVFVYDGNLIYQVNIGIE